MALQTEKKRKGIALFVLEIWPVFHFWVGVKIFILLMNVRLTQLCKNQMDLLLYIFESELHKAQFHSVYSHSLITLYQSISNVLQDFCTKGGSVVK